MMHEMVHLYNIAHNVQDCCRGGAYHNRKFKAEAERRGLVIEHHPACGWTITEPNDALIDYIIRQGWTEVHMSWGGGIWTPPKSGGSKAGEGGVGDGKETPKRRRSGPVPGSWFAPAEDRTTEQPGRLTSSAGTA